MIDTPMMSCGCAANAQRRLAITGEQIPCCMIHDCTDVVPAPDLTERQARCGCGKLVASDPDKAAFYEFRGIGSRYATDLCECGYTKSAHEKPHIAAKCQNFIARGPHEFDSFYCGCRGWD